MPRLARRIAASGFYHVMLRGDGRRILFEVDSDRREFLGFLEKYGTKYDAEFHAWCLMDNHVHLLIHDKSNALDKVMHDLCTSFARYYNEKNDRVGSVFQNRFTSIPIESDEGLLKVMRYIHQNPMKACLTKDLHYPWSSYDDYFRGASFTSTNLILDMLGGTDEYIKFCNQIDEKTYFMIEKEISGQLTDGEALELAKDCLGEKKFNRISSMGKLERDNCFRVLHRHGIPKRQVARLTGMGRSIVQRACAKDDSL